MPQYRDAAACRAKSHRPADFATEPSPTRSRTSPTLEKAMPLEAASHARCFSALPPGCRRAGVEHGADHPQGTPKLARAPTEHERPTRRRRIKAEQEAHSGGLSRAVRPEESCDHSRLDRKGQIVNREHAPVALGEPLHRDHWRTLCPSDTWSTSATRRPPSDTTRRFRRVRSTRRDSSPGTAGDSPLRNRTRPGAISVTTSP